MKIKVHHPNGYSGILYGKSSLAIYDDHGIEIIHTGYRTINTEKEHTGAWQIVADIETGVMYAVSFGVYNIGTFTLLVEADGKPMIYKGGQHGAD